MELLSSTEIGVNLIGMEGTVAGFGSTSGWLLKKKRNIENICKLSRILRDGIFFY